MLLSLLPIIFAAKAIQYSIKLAAKLCVVAASLMVAAGVFGAALAIDTARLSYKSIAGTLKFTATIIAKIAKALLFIPIAIKLGLIGVTKNVLTGLENLFDKHKSHSKDPFTYTSNTSYALKNTAEVVKKVLKAIKQMRAMITRRM